MNLFQILPRICIILLLNLIPQLSHGQPIGSAEHYEGTQHNSTIQIHLECGSIVANLKDGMVYARGVKYAEASRFAKPRSVDSWKDVKDCTQPATICPQSPSRLDAVTGPLAAGRNQSENCLHVSVAAPILADNLPVMVFFHGGAYLIGGGDLDAYSPIRLARKGAVVVTVTHRLGMFGYLPIPDIAPAILGLLDQIEALNWLRRNIQSFGGNATDVTIFGQSAGGDSIFALMAADGTEGLFHRAIYESAPLGRFNESNREDMTAAMSAYALNNISASNSPQSVSQLLALQTALLVVARDIDPTILPYGPIFGKDPLLPQSEAFERVASVAKQVPMFIGFNKDEGTALRLLDLSHTAEWYTQTLFADGANQLRQEIGDASGSLPPIYHFNWSPAGSSLGATHTIELPFLLGDWNAWRAAPMLNGSSAEEVEHLGSQMKDLWIAFATGSSFQGRDFIIDGSFIFTP